MKLVLGWQKMPLRKLSHYVRVASYYLLCAPDRQRETHYGFAHWSTATAFSFTVSDT